MPTIIIYFLGPPLCRWLFVKCVLIHQFSFSFCIICLPTLKFTENRIKKHIKITTEYLNRNENPDTALHIKIGRIEIGYVDFLIFKIFKIFKPKVNLFQNA